MTRQAPPEPAAAERDAERIAALRARYEALRREGQGADGFAARVAAEPRLPRPLPPGLVRNEEWLPPDGSWFGALPRGLCLRLDNPQGSAGVACLLWNAADPAERFSAADTVKVQWTAALGRGRVLLSDMGRVLAAIVDDTCGRHDALLGAGPPGAAVDASLAEARRGADNLLVGAAKLGLEPRDAHAPITFFADVRCGADGRFRWEPGFAPAGSHVDLLAEMDLLVVLSNSPHPLAPAGFGREPVRAQVWRPESAGLSGFCRAAGGEAERAFARTDAYRAASRDSRHAGRG